MSEKIYICSPYRGKVEENVQALKKLCREVLKYGKRPVAPHLYYTQFLDDTLLAERKCGMDMALEDMLECTAVWVYGSMVTEGMRNEIAFANAYGVPVEYKEGPDEAQKEK